MRTGARGIYAVPPLLRDTSLLLVECVRLAEHKGVFGAEGVERGGKVEDEGV